VTEVEPSVVDYLTFYKISSIVYNGYVASKSHFLSSSGRHFVPRNKTMKNKNRPAYVWALVLVLLGLVVWMVSYLITPTAAKTEPQHSVAETPITLLMVPDDKLKPVKIPLVSDDEMEDRLRAAGLGGGFATFSPSLREDDENN